MDLKNIIQWLRSSDDSQWYDVTRLLSETVTDLESMVHPPHVDTGGPSSESETFSPKASAINVAIPQLTKMVKALHEHRRAAALEYGQAALRLLPEG
jgi:hypothetical protein